MDVLSALALHLLPPTPPYTLPTLEGEPERMIDYVWRELHSVWAWVFAEMDCIERHVSLGNKMEGKLQSRGKLLSYRLSIELLCLPVTGHSESANEILESRKEFLSYALSLLRTDHQEHGGVLPSLDLSALEHLAWALDALYFLLKVCRSVRCTTEYGS